MNKIGEKWMAKALYEHCPICDGEGEVAPSKFRGSWKPEVVPDGRGNAVCPGCDGEGFIEVGLTVGQVERMQGQIDQLKAEIKRLKADPVAAGGAAT